MTAMQTKYRLLAGTLLVVAFWQPSAVGANDDAVIRLAQQPVPDQPGRPAAKEPPAAPVPGKPGAPPAAKGQPVVPPAAKGQPVAPVPGQPAIPPAAKDHPVAPVPGKP